jgi:hypothetical protein
MLERMSMRQDVAATLLELNYYQTRLKDYKICNHRYEKPE